MLRFILTNSLLIALWQFPGFAQGDQQCGRVVEAYLEIHTGPSEVYPVTHVFERDQQLCVVSSRTGWFKVTDSSGKQGWVSQDELLKALVPDD